MYLRTISVVVYFNIDKDFLVGELLVTTRRLFFLPLGITKKEYSSAVKKAIKFVAN